MGLHLSEEAINNKTHELLYMIDDNDDEMVAAMLAVGLMTFLNRRNDPAMTEHVVAYLGKALRDHLHTLTKSVVKQ